MFPAFPHAHFHSEPSGAAPVPEAALPPSHTLRGQHRKKPRSSFDAELHRGLPSSSLGFPKLVPWVIQSGSGNKMDPIQNSIQLASVANYI